MDRVLQQAFPIMLAVGLRPICDICGYKDEQQLPPANSGGESRVAPLNVSGCPRDSGSVGDRVGARGNAAGDRKAAHSRARLRACC